MEGWETYCCRIYAEGKPAADNLLPVGKEVREAVTRKKKENWEEKITRMNTLVMR